MLQRGNTVWPLQRPSDKEVRTVNKVQGTFVQIPLKSAGVHEFCLPVHSPYG
jgi:hypothetical protein